MAHARSSLVQNPPTLWAGYGQICAITTRAKTDEAATHLDALCGVDSGRAGGTYPLILKYISPPRTSSGSSEEDEGHLRKMLSYEVEQYFYSDVVPLLGDDIAVAKCLASTRDMDGEEGEELRGLMATWWPNSRREASQPYQRGRDKSKESSSFLHHIAWGVSGTSDALPCGCQMSN